MTARPVQYATRTATISTAQTPWLTSSPTTRPPTTVVCMSTTWPTWQTAYAARRIRESTARASLIIRPWDRCLLLLWFVGIAPFELQFARLVMLIFFLSFAESALALTGLQAASVCDMGQAARLTKSCRAPAALRRPSRRPAHCYYNARHITKKLFGYNVCPHTPIESQRNC